jgi:hypothetical protein
MDDAVTMRVRECVAHVGENRLHHRDRQRADLAKDGVERPSLHVLHDEVQDAVAFLDRVDGNDVRMTQRGRRPRLAFEPLHHAFSHEEQGRRQHLDRHFAIEREVVRQIHRGHPAAPQLAADLVFAQCGPAQRIKQSIPRRLGRSDGHGGHGVARRDRDARAAARAEGSAHPKARTAPCAEGGTVRHRSIR